jgi:quercetin dioxygenase-like cupin family protein
MGISSGNSMLEITSASAVQREERCLMMKSSLTALVRHELDHARQASSGRSAKTVYGGNERTLRQTVIALRAGTKLDEHENSDEATFFVLHGRVVLNSGESSWSGSAGDLLIVPEGRHALEAVEDAAVMFTVAKTRS